MDLWTGTVAFEQFMAECRTFSRRLGLQTLAIARRPNALQVRMVGMPAARLRLLEPGEMHLAGRTAPPEGLGAEVQADDGERQR
jgi:hypothetical protein